MWGDLGLPVKEFLKVIMTVEVRVLEKRRIKDNSPFKTFFFSFAIAFFFQAKSSWFGNHYSPSMFIFSFKKLC